MQAPTIRTPADDMPIEFRCLQCEKLLRVSDESAGAKAKCPSCGNIADVPSANRSDRDNGPIPDSSPAKSENPFGKETKPQPKASPRDGAPISGDQSFGPRSKSVEEVVATSTNLGPIFGYAWEVWKQNLGLLLGVSAVLLVFDLCFSSVQNGVQGGFARQGEQAAGQALGGIISITHSFIRIFLTIGQTKIVLKLLRGQPAEFGELFGGGPLYLRALGASILCFLMITVGMMICIIPGIAVWILLWPYFYLIVDEKARAIESFSMAAPLGQANVLTTIVMILASVAMYILGCLAACVGVLFAAPLVSLMWGAAYLMMSGQMHPTRSLDAV